MFGREKTLKEERWDSSYQNQHNGTNCLYEEVFQYQIMWGVTRLVLEVKNKSKQEELVLVILVDELVSLW